MAVGWAVDVLLSEAADLIAAPAAIQGTREGGLTGLADDIAAGKEAILRTVDIGFHGVGAEIIPTDLAVGCAGTDVFRGLALAVSAGRHAVHGATGRIVCRVGEGIFGGLADVVSTWGGTVFQAVDFSLAQTAISIAATMTIDLAVVAGFSRLAELISTRGETVSHADSLREFLALANLVSTRTTVDGAGLYVLAEFTLAVSAIGVADRVYV